MIEVAWIFGLVSALLSSSVSESDKKAARALGISTSWRRPEQRIFALRFEPDVEARQPDWRSELRSKWGWWKTDVQAIESIKPFAPKWLRWKSFLKELVHRLGSEAHPRRLIPYLQYPYEGPVDFQELAKEFSFEASEVFIGSGVFPAFLIDGFEIKIEPWGSMCIDNGLAPWRKRRKKNPWMQQRAFLPFAIAESEARVNLIKDEEDFDFTPVGLNWICDIWIGVPRSDDVEEEWEASWDYSLIQISIWKSRD